MQFQSLQNRNTFFALLCLLSLAHGACSSNPQPANETFAGVVAAATPEAADAGRTTLEAGGNAVDAAVAVAFALAVTEPAMSGLGGQTQVLIYPASGQPVMINGTSYAPRKLPPNMTASDIAGHRATTVPSTVKVLQYALQNYGSSRVSWAD
ncbi:MAG: gamma-glutamyltransferase, partial [candidate division KSB1 bacterium]|nr:gamma-glutamyltransferase [candidate division KSB1 bacterium]